MSTETEKSGRLARWSERKLGQDREEAEAAPSVPAATEAPQEASVVPPEDLDLPDIDSLTADSDFSAFMAEGVPGELKNLALRKLWRSDPVYANLDGLNDYDPEHVSFLVQAAETAKDMLGKALAAQPDEAPDKVAEAAADEEPIAAATEDDEVTTPEDEEPA